MSELCGERYEHAVEYALDSPDEHFVVGRGLAVVRDIGGVSADAVDKLIRYARGAMADENLNGVLVEAVTAVAVPTNKWKQSIAA
jgi:hypothetical protein